MAAIPGRLTRTQDEGFMPVSTSVSEYCSASPTFITRPTSTSEPRQLHWLALKNPS
ncbi:hypothetical protein DPMN_190479 [Dreissena polymorpha]|uniref:Uncharacterized protein n=1 Tax=Dreissena polymorpha TaxID=45954 RepID=A0A9D4DWX7_DREPO|nr:hypothetical protein DPMN_190479 [Dreissena polymorpha]